MKNNLFLFALSVLALFFSCEIIQEITIAEGGVVDFNNGKVKMVIPENAVDSTESSVSITVNRTAEIPQFETGSMGSSVYEMSPVGLTFKEPVDIEFEIDFPLRRGDIARIVFYKDTDEIWEVLETQERVGKYTSAIEYEGRISGEITQLSKYAVEIVHDWGKWMEVKLASTGVTHKGKYFKNFQTGDSVGTVAAYDPAKEPKMETIQFFSDLTYEWKYFSSEGVLEDEENGTFYVEHINIDAYSGISNLHLISGTSERVFEVDYTWMNIGTEQDEYGASLGATEGFFQLELGFMPPKHSREDGTDDIKDYHSFYTYESFEMD